MQYGKSWNQGSSPRMRGAPCFQRRTFAHSRIIPAYAGSTVRWRSMGHRHRDHSRVCGEHEFTPSRDACWLRGGAFLFVAVLQLVHFFVHLIKGIG